ncbi:hypothetical protein KI387_039772, partial [Taxus chinensis]
GLADGSAAEAVAAMGIEELVVEDVVVEVVDEVATEEEVVTRVDALTSIRTSLGRYNMLQVLKGEGLAGM